MQLQNAGWLESEGQKNVESLSMALDYHFFFAFAGHIKHGGDGHQATARRPIPLLMYSNLFEVNFDLIGGNGSDANDLAESLIQVGEGMGVGSSRLLLGLERVARQHGLFAQSTR